MSARLFSNITFTSLLMYFLQALYNLLHSKIAKRTDANPPKWTLLKKQEISSNLIDTNRQAAPNTSSASEAYSSLQQDFINKPLDPNVASFVSSQENAATSSGESLFIIVNGYDFAWKILICCLVQQWGA